MSSLLKQRSRSRPREFQPTPTRTILARLLFLTGFGLLTGAGIWLLWPARTGPIAIDLSNESRSTLVAVRRSQSWSSLEAAGKEIRSRLEGQRPDEARPLLEVLEAVAQRQAELATSDSDRVTALVNRLAAARGLAAAEQDRESLLKRTDELSLLSARHRNESADPLAREAFRSAFLAAQLTVKVGPPGKVDIDRLAALTASWVSQAADRFPEDLETTRAINDFLESFPQLPERDQLVKTVVSAVGRGYRDSPNPQIAEWADNLAVEQFLEEFDVVRQMAAPWLGDQSQLTQLQATAEQLLANDPNPVAVQAALELAQFLESFDQIDGARTILEKLVSQEGSAKFAERLEPSSLAARKMLERLSLFGQPLDLEFQVDGDKFVSREQFANSLALLVFYRNASDLELIAGQLEMLHDLQTHGLGFYLVGPELSGEERSKVALSVFRNAPDKALHWVVPQESLQLLEQLRVSYTPFPVIFNRGKVVSLGTPLNQGASWLEKRLFDK